MNDNMSLQSNHYFFSYLHFLREKRKTGIENFMRFRELNHIFSKKALSTFFQPIIDLKSDEIIGYEALNRPPSSKWFPSTEQFYQFIGYTNQVFSFDLYCRNLAIKRMGVAILTPFVLKLRDLLAFAVCNGSFTICFSFVFFRKFVTLSTYCGN